MTMVQFQQLGAKLGRFMNDDILQNYRKWLSFLELMPCAEMVKFKNQGSDIFWVGIPGPTWSSGVPSVSSKIRPWSNVQNKQGRIPFDFIV